MQGIRSSEVFREKLHWMRSQPFFQPEPVVFNSYELCKLAEQFVKAKGRTDYSVAELFYIDDDEGSGYGDVFVSHYQAELIMETTNAMESFEKSHIGVTHILDVFSIRQGVPDDFKSDYVEKLITMIGLTLMVAKPWNKPDTIKRVWCVFEILCTVQGDGDLSVAFANKEELSLMRKNKSEHKRLYKSICEILEEINVEEAEARTKSDCEDIMKKIMSGLGILCGSVCHCWCCHFHVIELNQSWRIQSNFDFFGLEASVVTVQSDGDGALLHVVFDCL